MQFVISAFTMLILGVIALIYPPAIATVCILVSNFETPGMSQVFINVFRVPEICMAGICLIAVGRAVYSIRAGRRKSIPSMRIYTLSVVALIVCIWMGVSSYFGDRKLADILRPSLITGVPGVIIAAVYHRDKLARRMFLFALIVQLLLAFCIVRFPGGTFDLLKPQLGASDETTDVGILASGISKTSGQFSNPVQLSFYGAIGIVVGLYLFLYFRKAVVRFMGTGLIALGMWASYVTVERAVWLGVLAASITLLLPYFSKIFGKALTVILVCGLLYVFCFSTISASNPAVNTLVSYFTQMPDNDYRLSAARNSMSVLLEQPVFGVNGDVRKIVEAAGGAPHQSFYFIAVMYGVPAGICVLLMTWWIFAPKLPGKITLRNKQFPSADRCLAHAIGWVVLFLALSNNMSAGMLGWMCLGYACLPWVYSVPIRKNPKFEIRSTKQAVISDE